MNITVHNTEKVPTKSLHNTLPSANLVVAQMQVAPWAEKLLTPIFGSGSLIGTALGGISILVASGIETVHISSKQMEKLQKENERREYLVRALNLAGLAIKKIDHLTKKQAQTQQKDLFDVQIYDKDQGISDYKVVFRVKDNITLKLVKTPSKKIEDVQFKPGEQFYVGKLGQQWILFHSNNHNYLLED